MMIDLKEVYTEINAKRQGDGLPKWTVEQFIEELSFAECLWLEGHVEVE